MSKDPLCIWDTPTKLTVPLRVVLSELTWELEINAESRLIQTLFNIPHGNRTQSGIKRSFDQEKKN